MADLFDRFVGSAGAITGHTADSLDTWGPSGTTLSIDGSGAAYSPAPTTPGYDFAGISSWNPPGTDYSASIVLGANARNLVNVGLVLRGTSASVGNLDAYLVYLTVGTPDTLDIYHETKVSGSSTLLQEVGTQQTLGSSFAAGDTWTATIAGTVTPVITVFRNGTQVYQATDSSGTVIATAGHPGFMIVEPNGGDASSAVISTMWAGAIGGPTTTITPSTATVALGGTQAFTAATAHANETFTWTSSAGSISGTGATETWTAPGSGSSATVTWTSIDLPASKATASITLGASTTYTFVVPSSVSGYVGIPSRSFTVTPNASYDGTITITPIGGGLSIPIILTFSSATPQTFTITPTSAGVVTLTPTNSGGLTDPAPLAYTANPVPDVGIVIPYAPLFAPVNATAATTTTIVPNLTVGLTPQKSIVLYAYMLSRGDANSGTINFTWKDSTGATLWGPLDILSQGQGNSMANSQTVLELFATAPGADLDLALDAVGLVGGGVCYFYR